MLDPKSVLVAAAFSLTLLPSTAMASTLDFTGEWGLEWQGVNSKALTNATIFTFGADLYSYGDPNGFCGTTEIGGFDCTSDSLITFNSAVNGLTFSSYAFNDGDFAVARIYSDATFLASINVISNMLIDFSSYSGITVLVLDDQGSTGLGLGYRDFNFGGTEVPLPAALPLLAAGLGALGLAGWRKRSRVLTS